MSKFTGINNDRITASQLTRLLFLFALGSSALVLTTAIIDLSKQDSWLSWLLITPLQYFVILIYLSLAKRFPRRTLIQYAEKLLGVWAGKLLGLTYVVFFLMLSALVLKNIIDFIKLAALPITPSAFFCISLMLVISYALFLGIEAIARTGELLFMWGLFMIIITLLLLTWQIDLDNFQPVLYHGWSNALKAMYPIVGFPVAEFVFITMLLPAIKDEERRKLWINLNWGLIVLCIISTVLIVFTIGVLGVFETSRSTFPVYDAAKNISIQQILVRVEILFGMLWISTVFIKLVLCVYVLTVATSQTIGSGSYKPYIIPYAFLIIPLALHMYRNNAHSLFFIKYAWTPYSAIQGIIIPLFLWLTAIVLRQRD